MNQRSRSHSKTASTVPAILHNMAHVLGNSLYKSLLKVVLTPLYQMSSFAHAAEIIESMSMTVQPVLCFHVIAGFCIDIVNSKGCRCVPARCCYCRPFSRILQFQSVKFDKSNPSDFIRINHTTSSKKLENEG